MGYYEYEIPTGSWSTAQMEIALATMAHRGFEGFIEGEEAIRAFVDEDQHSDVLPGLLAGELQSMGIEFDCQVRKGEEKNWNEEWEKGFDPVVVGKNLLIRASFHDDSGDLPHTIIIEPRMAFGTGHHSTTRLVLLEMMHHNLTGRRVLDLGCGTGILGIFASLSGASRVLALDTDERACENALENLKRNRIRGMEVRQGDLTAAGGELFDLVLANLDRNTLVNEMEHMAGSLLTGGLLVVSGILDGDAQPVRDSAGKYPLRELNAMEDSNWVSLTFVNHVDSD